MEHLLLRLRRRIFMLSILLVPTIGYAAQGGTHLGVEPQDSLQREWVLTEMEYAAKELYYSIQAGAWGNRRQLMRVIKKYNDCKNGFIC